jgi:hypothetical protein
MYDGRYLRARGIRADLGVRRPYTFNPSPNFAIRGHGVVGPFFHHKGIHLFFKFGRSRTTTSPIQSSQAVSRIWIGVKQQR